MSKFKYISSTGQPFDLCASPIWVQSFNPFRSFSFEPIVENGGFYGFRKPQNVTYQLVLQCYTKDEAQLKALKNQLNLCFTADVRSNTPGQFWADDYCLYGFVYGDSVDTYDRRRGLCSSQIPVFSRDALWLKSMGTLDLYTETGSLTVTNPSPTPSPFVLTIKSPFSYPEVYVNGVKHSVWTYTTLTGYSLVIDSVSRTIVETGGGTTSNMLSYRNGEIFEPIPPGPLSVEIKSDGAVPSTPMKIGLETFDAREWLPWV